MNHRDMVSRLIASSSQSFPLMRAQLVPDSS